MNKIIKDKLIVGFGTAIAVFTVMAGIQYAVAAWTTAPVNPPNGNVDAPLNVGSSHQVKLGSLSINTDVDNPDQYGLDVFGISRFFGNIEVGSTVIPATIKIIDGNQGSGKILVSDASGNASWQDPATAVNSGSGGTIGGGSSAPASLEYKTCTTQQGGYISGNSCTASCTIGKKVIGGGCSTSQPSPLFVTKPNSDGSGWYCENYSNNQAQIALTGYAICE